MRLCMRTTLTLDSDVAKALQRVMDKRGASLKQVVNEALRRGLDSLERPARRQRFRTAVVSLRPRRANVDDVAELLAFAEGDEYR